MAEKKYQVFISSTYADLKEERRKILDILLMADCIPAGMEAFVASDVEQFEVIKKVIELCDYYILIIGKRYGSISQQTGMSYTEMEYEYAKALGIPVLVFALDESVDVPEEKRETEQTKIDALKTFRQKALTNRLATIWKTQDELIGAVAISIMRATKEIQRPGWQRATDYDEVSLRRDIMELQKKNENLAVQLDDAQKKLTAITQNDDVAFEGCKVNFEYRKEESNKFAPSKGSVQRELTDIFRIISIEMLDTAITEDTIDFAIRREFFRDSSGKYSFTDRQLIKKILTQLKALGLVESKWGTNHHLYWYLTTKGEVTRAKMVLVRDPDKIK